MQGDRLQVGPIELEVRHCPLVPTEWTTQSADLPETTQCSESEREAWENASAQSAALIEGMRGEMRDLERRATQQLSELNDLVGRVSTERDGLQQRLRTIEYEAAGERDTLFLAKQQMELALAASEQQITELRGRLTSRELEIESALDAQSQRLAETEGRLAEALGQRASLEAQLREQALALHSQCEHQQAERDRLQAECRRLDEQLAQFRELVGYTAADRDRLTLQIDTDQRRLSEQQQQLAEEKAELQRRLEATAAQLADAEHRLAAIQAERHEYLHSDREQLSNLQQRLDQAVLEKGELQKRLSDQTSAWHGERESLRQQTERVSDHSKQLEGQLGHVRELVESLASERDSICQQLEATEMRLAAEQEQFQQERAAAQAQLAAAQQQQSQANQETLARLDAQTALAEQWRQRAEDAQQQVSAAGQQLAEATERFAALRGESESRLHDESGKAAQLARQADESRERLAAVQAQLADAETRLVVLQTESEQRLQTEQRRNSDSERRANELAQQLEAQLARQKDESGERLAAVQTQLADAETRLAALQTESDQRLQSERRRSSEAERRADELAQQLAASDVRLREAERRLSAFRTEGDARVHEESARALEAEQKAREAGEWLAVVKQQLAESEARCTDLAAENEKWRQAKTQLAELEQQFAESEARCVSLAAESDVQNEKCRQAQVQLAALEQQVATSQASFQTVRLELESRLQSETEARISELKSTYEARLQVEAQRSREWESRTAQLESDHSALRRQLDDLTETVRVERDGWNRDRERLDDERRTIGHRLAEKQQEVDQLQEQVRTAAELRPQMTISMDQLHEAAMESNSGDPPADWEIERQRLEERVVELEQQLSESRQFTQGMTLGREAMAELRSATIDEQVDPQVAELQSQLEALQSDLAQACAWRERYEGAQAKVEQLEERLAAGPSDPAADDLASLSESAAPLAQLQAHYDEQSAAPARDPEALADERACLEAAAQELRRERDEFAQTQTEFETRWREWEESLRGKEQLLNRQAQELADRLERVAARTEEIERQRTQMAEQQAVLERQAAALLAAHPGAGGSETAATSLSAAPLANERDVDPSRFELSEFPGSAPPDALTGNERSGEDLQQPRSDGQVPEHCAAQFASSPSPASDTPKPVWTPPNTPPPAADDDSIEAYMSRLLRRVRGDGSPGAPALVPPVPMPQPASVEEAAPSPELEPSEPVTRTMVANIDPVMPEDYLPRNKAPELTASLAAMRELANSAARTAIVKHQRRSGGKLALTQSVGAVLTLLCAVVAGYFALKTHSLPAAGGACLGLLAAAYWGSKAAGHGLKALMLRPPAASGAAPPQEAPPEQKASAPLEASADSTVGK